MKKLLVLQLDDAYFLFETLQVLDKYRDVLKDFELTLLCDPKALAQIPEVSRPPIPGITTKSLEVLRTTYDLSVNFSLNDAAWPLHDSVKATRKLGPSLRDGKELLIPDAWSTYLLTIKARAPFLTFHLQDIYKNILGVKRIPQPKKSQKKYQQIAVGLSNPTTFPASEQEKLLKLLSTHHPNLKIKDLSEVDLLSDLSSVLYVGPANLDALKICENGASGIFLTSQFQGFNLLPSNEGHFLVSSKNQAFEAQKLIGFIDAEITEGEMPEDFSYSAYQIDEENLFGSYLRALNQSDDSYPVYQCHVVLWNFVLNLFDINLEVTRGTPSQLELLRLQLEVLTKLNRLYDYAMSSVDTILQEARAQASDNAKIQGHSKNLQEMEVIVDNISQSNSFLRPILDFYRMRRGQNSGETLLEQAQHSFLTYSEEHQALKALQELFTVTLRKNDVSI